MYNIAVFVSGRGSNLKAVYDFFGKNSRKVQVSAVISNKADCRALEFAADNRIDTFVVSGRDISGKISYDRLADELTSREIDLIVLAGFLKKIPDSFVEAFENKIINIHPALLPSFGGPGMYGRFVHEAVFKTSCKVSGPTVHFVNKVYDDGLIVAQRAVDISAAQNPEEIAAAVLKEEHKILPWVIEKFADGKVEIIDNRIKIN